MSTLYFTIKKDFEFSKIVTAVNASQIQCIYGNGKVIEYDMNDIFIVRHQHERIDTFYCKAGMPLLFFGQNTIDTYPSVINKLAFEWGDSVNHVTAHIMKSYDASSLMEIIRKDSLQ